MDRIFAKLLSEMTRKRDTILVTIIADVGSTPRGAGSQMLVSPQGRVIGTIGGGSVEDLAEHMSLVLIKEKRSMCHVFQLHERAKEDIGMVCGGDIKVLFQFIPADSLHWVDVARFVLARVSKREPGWLVLKTDGSLPELLDGRGKALLGDCVPGFDTRHGWIPFQSDCHFCMSLPIGERAFLFGAGHCAQALAPMLQTVGFRVTVFDDRAVFASRENFPTADHVFVGDYTKLSDYIQFTEDDYAVIMTNGHSYDLEVQDQLLRGDFAYMGVIGSRKKTAVVNQRLRDRGVPEDAIARVHTPIGAAIGAVTPEEIAVSITAEMIHVRSQRRKSAALDAIRSI